MKITRRIVVATAVAGGLAAAFVAGTGSGTSAPASASPPPPPIASAAGVTALTPEAIYKRNAPGVVVITATETQHVAATAFSPPLTERVKVLGSGFVIDGRGDILTNDHVVRAGRESSSASSSGASFPATIVGTDLSSDLAVIHVRAPAEDAAPTGVRRLGGRRGRRSRVRDRQPARARPHDDRGNHSARGRDIQAPNGHTITSAIQTDAPINHGNSGGPLLDATVAWSGSTSRSRAARSNGGSIGIGFAISSDTAKSVADQLIATGHVEHAWLGAQVETISRVLPGLYATCPPTVSSSPACSRAARRRRPDSRRCGSDDGQRREHRAPRRHDRERRRHAHRGGAAARECHCRPQAGRSSRPHGGQGGEEAHPLGHARQCAPRSMRRQPPPTDSC